MKGDIFMVNQFENRISGDSPFKPEFEQYVSSHPGRGSLKVQVSAANRSFPVKNVFVEVAVDEGGILLGHCQRNRAADLFGQRQ